MNTFKEQIQNDLDVLYDTDLFADDKVIFIDGKEEKIRAIIDDQTVKDRSRDSNDHAKGISQYDLKLSFPEIDLGYLPKQGLHIEVDDAEYKVTSSTSNYGEVTLYLERYGE